MLNGFAKPFVNALKRQCTFCGLNDLKYLQHTVIYSTYIQISSYGLLYNEQLNTILKCTVSLHSHAFGMHVCPHVHSVGRHTTDANT